MNAERYRQLSPKGKYVFWLLLNLCLFIVLECGTRVAYALVTWNPYYLTYGRYDRNWGPKFRDYLEPHGGYYKFRPNRMHVMGEEKIPTRINNHGFRGRDFDREKGAGVFRVVALGESSTFAFHSSDFFTYPALLERRLNHAYPCETRFEVINAGMPWITSDQIASLFLEEIVTYAPDAITIYAGHNDAVGGASTSEIERARLGTFSRWWEKRSLILRELTFYPRDRLLFLNEFAEYLKKAIQYRMSVERAAAVSNDIQRLDTAVVDRDVSAAARSYERNVRRILDVARSLSIRVVLVTQPMTLRYTYADMRKTFGASVVSDDDLVPRSFDDSLHRIKSKLMTEGNIMDFEASMLRTEANMSVLRQLADEYEIPLADFFPLVARDPGLLVSFVHLSETGNDRLAELLHEKFAAERIGCAEPSPGSDAIAAGRSHQ